MPRLRHTSEPAVLPAGPGGAVQSESQALLLSAITKLLSTLLPQGPEELFETVSQALLSGQDRDCLAGWGAVVYVITKDKVIARTLKGRMD